MRGVDAPRLDPESWRTLRQLIKLHGYTKLTQALRVQQMIDILEPEPESFSDATREGDAQPTEP